MCQKVDSLFSLVHPQIYYLEFAHEVSLKLSKATHLSLSNLLSCRFYLSGLIVGPVVCHLCQSPGCTPLLSALREAGMLKNRTHHSPRCQNDHQDHLINSHPPP